MKVVMKLADLRDSQLTILWMSGKKYSREMTVKQHRHNFINFNIYWKETKY